LFYYRIYPSIRKANAQCNLNINQQLQKEREELLSGGSKAIDTRDKMYFYLFSFPLHL